MWEEEKDSKSEAMWLSKMAAVLVRNRPVVLAWTLFTRGQIFPHFSPVVGGPRIQARESIHISFSCVAHVWA